MTIGLLVCDHLDPDLWDVSGGDYKEVYSRLLHSADPDLEIRSYDVINGELPTSPDECEGWLITGARENAFSTEPWVDALRGFVRDIDDRRARLVGICFGHQVIAEALGGRVERAPGWKVAPQVMDMSEQPWFAGGRVAIHAMHRDVVTELPEGAVPIATGDTAEYPAFRIGDHILTVQDHPEYGPAFIRRIIGRRVQLIGEAEAADGLARVDGPTDRDTVARWIVDFLKDVRIS